MPKIRETRAVYMQQERRLWHATITPRCNPKRCRERVTHIIVTCHHLLSYCIYKVCISYSFKGYMYSLSLYTYSTGFIDIFLTSSRRRNAILKWTPRISDGPPPEMATHEEEYVSMTILSSVITVLGDKMNFTSSLSSSEHVTVISLITDSLIR